MEPTRVTFFCNELCPLSSIFGSPHTYCAAHAALMRQQPLPCTRRHPIGDLHLQRLRLRRGLRRRHRPRLSLC